MSNLTELVQAHAQKQEILVPDCCNIGIVTRVLVFVNALVLVALLSRGSGWRVNLQEFVESSMLVESICLLSLFCLCGVRQLLLRQSAAAWMQRICCGTIPALVAFAVVYGLEQVDWFAYSFSRLNIGFISLLCFCIGIGLQHYFEMRTKAFSPALGEAKLQALQARIRPHFLFNSLNAVLSLIRTQPKKAETMLEDLADLFRVLMRDTRDITTLREEVFLCEQYLSIEKVRLGERLQVEWEFHKLSQIEMSELKIPALLLQPLLENAVHYGVEPSAAASLILVRLSRSLDKLEICVRNPLHRHARRPVGNHMALTNIRQRLKLLYDIEAQLRAGEEDQDFVVNLIIPAKT